MVRNLQGPLPRDKWRVRPPPPSPPTQPAVCVSRDAETCCLARASRKWQPASTARQLRSPEGRPAWPVAARSAPAPPPPLTTLAAAVARARLAAAAEQVSRDPELLLGKGGHVSGAQLRGSQGLSDLNAWPPPRLPTPLSLLSQPPSPHAALLGCQQEAYGLADHYLSESYDECLASAASHKRKIIKYLAPVGGPVVWGRGVDVAAKRRACPTPLLSLCIARMSICHPAFLPRPLPAPGCLVYALA